MRSRQGGKVLEWSGVDEDEEADRSYTVKGHWKWNVLL
jgi:hypothetical protein